MGKKMTVKTLIKLSSAFIIICISILPSYAQGTWEKITDHPAINGLYGSNANIVNDDIYTCWGLAQGSVPSSALYAYNIPTNTWTQKRDFPGYGRYNSTSFVIGNNIYYMGGTVGQTPYFNDLWAYNVLDNTWRQKASMPGNGRIVAMSFVINGKGYVTGGATDNVTYLHDTWEYNPVLDSWIQKASIPTNNNTGIVAASSFVLHNKGYICGGKYAVQSYLDSTWQYDPAIDKWESKASLPINRGTLGGFGFSLNDNTPDARGYYGLGVNNTLTPYTTGFYEYDAFTDKWTPISLFTGKGRYYGIACVSKNQAYIGFGSSDYVTSTYEKDIWKLSFPVNPDTLSIRGKIHQGNAFLKNGKVTAHNLINDFKYFTYTDNMGDFLFESLSLGEYILKAIPNIGENYNSTFYPNTSDSLKTVKLTLGGSITEIDMYMNSSKTDSDSVENVSGYFSIQPNPFENTLKVVSSNKDIQFKKIHILNVTGGTQQEILLNEATNSCDIHMDTIKQGMYILKIETQNGTYLKKIMKE